MNHANLLALIGRARERDRRAQAKITELFWRDVFSFIMRRLDDRNTADELSVFVFSKVLSKLETFDPNFRFKTWVLAIAQNTLIDYWRKQGKEKTKNIESSSEVEKNICSRSPEEILISQEERARLLRAIRGMKPAYKNVLDLRFLQGKSVKETAIELQLSVSNTKVRIMRAKRILAELLKANENT